MITEQLSQALSIAATELDPVSQGIATVTTGGVDMSKFERVMFVLMVGALGGAGTVDAKLQECTSAGGAGASDIAGSNITQLTVGGSGSNKIVTLEIKASQLTAGKSFVRLSVTVGGNAVLIAACPLGGEARQKPGSAQDIAAVFQRKVV
jgi:hypothetical protein